MSFIVHIVSQLIPNLFHMQHSMGIVTGVIGLLSTLAALNSFADTCFRSLDSNLPNLSLTKTPGAAFILLLIATVFKVVDVWAHIIVPVPKHDYWSPSNDPSSEGDSKKRHLIDPTQASSV